MDAETIRAITTSTISATFTLAATTIAAFLGYRLQKAAVDTKKQKEFLDQRTRELLRAYEHISAYYQLEQIYSEELSKRTGEAQKTIKSRFRQAVEDAGFSRPEMTSGECNKAIKELQP